jgi:hypothetical protein
VKSLTFARHSACALLLLLCSLSTSAWANNCWTIVGWVNPTTQAAASGVVGNRAVLAPAACVAPAPAGFGWLRPALAYSGAPPSDLYVRISLSAPQVTGGASGYFSPLLVYNGRIAGTPDLRVDLLPCIGCSNQMPFVYQPGPCLRPVTWWNGTRYAGYDTANCYVTPVPAGATPFIYGNSYYVGSQQTTICQIGSYDSANCYYGPATSSGFINNNSFYRTPGAGNTCSQGVFDGANCFIATVPPGSRAFIYAGNFYATTRRCAVGSFDGANCYLGTPPSFPTPTTAFIYAGAFYYAE